MGAIEPRRAVTGDEVDAYGAGRKHMGREVTEVKRRTNRRERQERKADAARELRQLED